MAIAEGRAGAGFVSPNPLVGCVILDREGLLIGKGYHARLGDLHAEAAALKSVADPKRLEGAHVIVTLEPCAHEGRQPSCAKHLARLPVARVTYGRRDPNPLVAGQGAEILKAAGKQVELFSQLETELEELAEIFLLNQRERRAFVALKTATSLDGQIALSDGQSQWITGPEARARVGTLRGEYDAVLTGAGTVLRDDPRMNARDAKFAGKPATLVLLDHSGATLEGFARRRLLEVREPKDIILVTSPSVSSPPEGVRHVTLPLTNGEFDLRALLDVLRTQHGLHSLFVEAGAHTNSSFLRQHLVDRLYLFQAPKLLGQGLNWTSQLKITRLDQALRLSSTRVELIGEDVLWTGRFARST